GHGFRRVRTGPDIYQHAHVEVEDHAGFLYVRRYASPERRSVTWSAGYSPSTPPELVITAILAAFTPIPVARDDAGTWSVWAAVPLTVGVGLSLDSARAATRWLQARGWPYATHQPDASSPPAGTPASQPHIS
ncbi:hypothetical protein, partial [Frankia sp. KB5]|uniref:hypothetical protein n=1 Tax=Frankia sp. KB5 TaxID=683318 RepID=UPI000A0FBD54